MSIVSFTHSEAPIVINVQKFVVKKIKTTKFNNRGTMIFLLGSTNRPWEPQ
jgi:hypothetical protein